MKRSPLRRRARLRRTPMARRRRPLRQRSPNRRPRPDADPAYLTWLRRHACACPQLPRHPGGDPHHPRHELGGGAVGANLKSSDHRAVPLSRQHHRDIHALAGPFRGWTKQQVHDWLDVKAVELRAEYLGLPPRQSEPAPAKTDAAAQ